MVLSDILLNPKGRLSVSGFWGAFMGSVSVTGFLGFFLNRLPVLIRQSEANIDTSILFFLDSLSQPLNLVLIAILPLGWMTFVVWLKRLHDRNKSIWWLLLLLLPVVGWLWLLIEVGFKSGTSGRNRFGDSPIWQQAERLMAAANADEDMA